MGSALITTNDLSDAINANNEVSTLELFIDQEDARIQAAAGAHDETDALDWQNRKAALIELVRVRDRETGVRAAQGATFVDAERKAGQILLSRGLSAW